MQPSVYANLNCDQQHHTYRSNQAQKAGEGDVEAPETLLMMAKDGTSADRKPIIGKDRLHA